jgi:PEP-CTERM motif
MRISKIVALGALAVGAIVAVVPTAQAAFIATIEQVGANVVVTGSGTLDLAGLTLDGLPNAFSAIAPNQGVLSIGLPEADSADLYSGSISGPANFGSGGVTGPSDSGSGDKVGLNTDVVVNLVVPRGYVSGSALADSSTYDNATLASLGATPGAYTWTWGTGLDADSFTIQVGPAATDAPEPASLALLGTGLAALGLNRRRRRKGV